MSEIIESDRACNSDDPTQLRFHPLADLFPLMEGEEFDALVADIKAHGLREPIVLLDEKILDGRNRCRACLAAGVEPILEKHFSAHHSTGEALAFIISKNIHRRHLTAEQKRDLIAKLIEVAPEKSDRAIAKQAKVDGKTVASVRREKEARAEIPHVETRTDTKGRKQPAKKTREAKKAKADADKYISAESQRQTRKKISSRRREESNIRVVEENGRKRPATPDEVAKLGDAISRTQKYPFTGTACNVEAALGNPILQVWRVGTEFNRKNFVLLAYDELMALAAEVKQAADEGEADDGTVP